MRPRTAIALGLTAVLLASPAMAAGEIGTRKATEAAQAQTQGNLDLALSLFSEALADATLANDRRAAILSDRGVVYARLGQVKPAIEDFNRSVQLLPESAMAYNNRGNVLLAVGLAREAVKDFDRALLLAPGYAAAYANRASAYLELKQSADAQRDFSRAILLMPTAPAPALVGRGRASLAGGKPQAAIRDFSRAISADGRFALAYRSRAEARLETDRYNDAVEDLSRAAAFEAANPELYILRGQAYLAARNVAAAIKDFSTAAELDPQSARALAWRAAAQMKVDAFDEADADLTKALEIDPRASLAYAFRALLLVKSEQASLAGREYEKAARIETDRPELVWVKAEIDEAQGRSREAIDGYRKALAAKGSLRDAAEGLERLGAGEISGVVADAVNLDGTAWSVVRKGRHLYASSNAIPKLLVPLETVSDVQPKLIDYDEKKGAFRGFATLRFSAGETTGGPVEHIALIDLAAPSVLAIIPHREGNKIAEWNWDDGKVSVTATDGFTDQYQLRPSRPQPTIASARRDDGRPQAAWNPWDGPNGFFGAPPPPGKQARGPQKKPKNLFDLLFGN